MERKRGSLSPKDNAHMVRYAVIRQRDRRAACERRAIEFNRRHPSRNPVWVLDGDFVARRVIAE